jgi:aspartyl-tRNA(Asn)/glutamyl-tRNA(Gln) amidotransferase subunit A
VAEGRLPAGLQIVVRRFDDPLALRIGRTLEREAGFVVRTPPGFCAPAEQDF